MASILSAKSRLNWFNYYHSGRRAAKGRRFWRLKKPVKMALLAGLAIVVMQFLYPWDTTLPFAHVGQTGVGSSKFDEAGDRLSAAFGSWRQTVKTATHEYGVTNVDLGMSLDAQATAVRAGYAWWQRLVPGSFLWRLVSSGVQPVVNVEDDKLAAFSDKLQQENYQAYKNASIRVEDGQADIVPHEDGQDYPASDVANALKRDFFVASDTLKVQPKTLNSVITTNHVEQTLRDTQEILSAPPKYVINGRMSDVSKALLGQWLAFTENEHERRLEVSIGVAAVENYFYGLYPYVYKTQSGNLAGDSDYAINIASAVEGLKEVLNQKGHQVTVEIASQAVTSELGANREYSPSQLGLQTLLQDIVDEKGNYAIAVQQLDSPGWSAVVNGGKKYTPASTYKLFVAYSVLKKIEAGEWTWNGRMAGYNLEYCFDVMIINSDNTCAEAFGLTIGWKNIEQQMQDLGLKDTTLTPGYFISTANDLALFMAKLGRGEILAQTSRDKLIDVMKRQVYRDGIPAGTNVPVADKVGFLFGLLHDAALVYSPNGAYVLVILTNNSTWGNIADAAAKIQQHLD